MELVNHFVSEILKINRETKELKNICGVHIIPVIELYRNLTTYEEKRAFQDAIERLLVDSDEDIRSYGVDICLGFFVFRDSI